MKQANIQMFGKPPLPRGYSTSHILTYRKCEYKFLLTYIYKVKTETKFQPMLFGSDVHDDISKGIFESEYPEKQRLLNVAKLFLSETPCNPVFETNYEDKNNPGTYKGYLFEHPFIGTFDVHWVNERIGADWKTGNFHKEYKNDYEIQAYILNELFKQKHGYGLDKFVFVFLKDGFRYEAECITVDKAKKRKETMIYNALDSIKRLEFKKKVSFGCQWCDYQKMCI